MRSVPASRLIHLGTASVAVMDTDAVGVAIRLRDVLAAPRSEPFLALALHVGGLNELDDPEYGAALAAADLVYADGMAVVLLARLAGATHVRRTPTTDLGWSVLAARPERNSPLRVALIGGPPGLAKRASERLASTTGCTDVYHCHGYQEEWTQALADLAAASPDVIFVGLGASLEAKWVARYKSSLPPAVVITCGGWFGFVVGDEQRAPKFLSSTGLEWTWRLRQAPRRLIGRYAKGCWTVIRFALPLARQGCHVAVLRLWGP